MRGIRISEFLFFFVYHSVTPKTVILEANIKSIFASKQNHLPLCPSPIGEASVFIVVGSRLSFCYRDQTLAQTTHRPVRNRRSVHPLCGTLGNWKGKQGKGNCSKDFDMLEWSCFRRDWRVPLNTPLNTLGKAMWKAPFLCGFLNNFRVRFPSESLEKPCFYKAFSFSLWN